MLVKEGSTDCAIAFESAGELQATLGSNRGREGNHRLSWRVSIRGGGCWEIRWIKSNRVRLTNRCDQLSDTDAGSLLIGSGSADRLGSRGCTSDLGKISLEHCPANRVAIGRKDTTN